MQRQVVRTLTFLLLLMIGGPSFISNAQGTPDSAVCAPIKPAAPGTQVMQVKVGDIMRRYLVYIPQNYAPMVKHPLVIGYHGFTNTAEVHAEITGWNALADRESFVVAYGQGLGFPPRWNNGINPFVPEDTLDDVSYTKAMIADITEKFCIDSARIYGNGFSAGGGMVNRLACEATDLFAAVGGVAGAYSTLKDGCNPARPISVIALHGDADTIANFNGDQSFGIPKIDDFVAAWAARNGCAEESTALEAVGNGRGVRYTNCEADALIEYWVIEGGTHTWFGGQVGIQADSPDASVNATELLWTFFKEIRRPE